MNHVAWVRSVCTLKALLCSNQEDTVMCSKESSGRKERPAYIFFIQEEQWMRFFCMSIGVCVCVCLHVFLSRAGMCMKCSLHCALPTRPFLDPSKLSKTPQGSPSLSEALSRSSSPRSSSSSSSSSSGDGSLQFSVPQLSSSSSASCFTTSAGGGGGGRGGGGGALSLHSVWSSNASGFSSISLINGGIGPGISIFRVIALSAPGMRDHMTCLTNRNAKYRKLQWMLFYFYWV